MTPVRLSLICALIGTVLLMAAPAYAAGPTATTGSASAVGETTATLNGTVNAAGGPVIFCEFEYATSAAYGATGTYTNSSSCSPTPSGDSSQAVSASLTGLSLGTSYDFEVVLETASSLTPVTGGNKSFTTLSPVPVPTASTQAATAVTGTGATLNAEVDAKGGSVTSCQFVYGTSTSYGSSAQCSPTPSGSSQQAVSATVKNLPQDTTYHFRVVLQTAGGTATGADETFTTLVVGTATTRAATALSATGATANGTVNPMGQTVKACAFYYGALSAGHFTAEVPCSQSTGSLSGSSPVAVSASITQLTAHAEYEVVLVLTTSNGYATGQVVDFTTLTDPTGRTGAASPVTSTTATLHATLNAHGARTVSCEFQYGTSPGSDTHTARCSPKPSGSTAVAVSAALKALSPSTTYFYQVVLQTQAGIATTTSRSFRTKAKPKKGKARK